MRIALLATFNTWHACTQTGNAYMHMPQGVHNHLHLQRTPHTDVASEVVPLGPAAEPLGAVRNTLASVSSSICSASGISRGGVGRSSAGCSMKLADSILVELHGGHALKAASGASHSPIRQMVL